MHKRFFCLPSNEIKKKVRKKKSHAAHAPRSRGPHLPNDGAGEALLQLQWCLIVWCSALRQIVPVAGSYFKRQDGKTLLFGGSMPPESTVLFLSNRSAAQLIS